MGAILIPIPSSSSFGTPQGAEISKEILLSLSQTPQAESMENLMEEWGK